MILQAGKSYKYIGGLRHHRGNTYECIEVILIERHTFWIQVARMQMGTEVIRYHVDGKGLAQGKQCWEEIPEPIKPKVVVKWQ